MRTQKFISILCIGELIAYAAFGCCYHHSCWHENTGTTSEHICQNGDGSSDREFCSSHANSCDSANDHAEAEHCHRVVTEHQHQNEASEGRAVPSEWNVRSSLMVAQRSTLPEDRHSCPGGGRCPLMLAKGMDLLNLERSTEGCWGMLTMQLTTSSATHTTSFAELDADSALALPLRAHLLLGILLI